jgi:uncharacterized membrane protein (DUF4010 family)
MARQARTFPYATKLLASGMAVAIALCFFRVLIIAVAFRPTLMAHLLLPLGAAGLTSAFCSHLFSSERSKPELTRSMKLKNPFSFWPVIAFAVFLGFITLIIRIASEQFGQTGVVFGAGFVGLTEVDAVTLSIARSPESAISNGIAAKAILAGVISNTAGKVAIAGALGGRRLMLLVAVPVTLSLFASAIGFSLSDFIVEAQ